VTGAREGERGKGDMPPPGNSHAEKKLWVFG